MLPLLDAVPVRAARGHHHLVDREPDALGSRVQQLALAGHRLPDRAVDDPHVGHRRAGRRHRARLPVDRAGDRP